MVNWKKIKERIKIGLEPPDDDEILIEDSTSSGYKIITPNVSAEREEELIEKVVTRIKKMKMEAAAILTLEAYKPVSRPFGEIYGLFSAPILELFDLQGYDYALLISKRKNIQEIINRLKKDD